MSELADHMDTVREAIVQESDGVLNGCGNPVSEAPAFKTFVRMITPDDVLAVTSKSDVNTIARGLRMMVDASGRGRGTP